MICLNDHTYIVGGNRMYLHGRTSAFSEILPTIVGIFIKIKNTGAQISICTPIFSILYHCKSV